MPAPQNLPKGHHSVNASLNFNSTKDALAFYQNAFGAEQLACVEVGGKVMHAEILIGDSAVMMSDESIEMGAPSAATVGASPTMLRIQTDDVDKMFQQAVDAGANALMPPTDMFWGDRISSIADPFGYRWNIVTKIKDVPPEEIQQMAEQFFGGGA
ncbi:VOC family protein [Rubellicoccus peritrichatus]|uniref:VOC family protein n=1 Tax=Rubellicoccus peritrichatus TaxID=3080537 RepID=A0AAQ3L987_9BACT|nr:VOC family protein [Puniceicoccus sp. CR14]WOO40269.1 VOC family protein [Puniceicoccus sp. CR14]